MQKNIIWKGVYYQSIENCHIKTTNDSVAVKSQIIGCHEDIIYEVTYNIMTNKDWQTQYVDIAYTLNNIRREIKGERNVNGQWAINGEIKNELHACVDIDISLTPFTNSLPINRLQLEVGKAKPIDVLYIDVLEQKIIPVKQNYTRLSDTEYKYENVPNDFEAVIEVDTSGLVVNYPELFKRIMIQ